ncbi:MAG: helix-hairpin-helix domain-containing protein [Thermoplasmata archaeon]
MPKDTTDISEIEDIKGVGSSLAKRIKDTLDIDSVEELASFSEEEFTRVKGIGSGKAKNISEQLESLTTTCDRCGEEHLAGENCPECTQELEEELKGLKERVESEDVEQSEDIEEKIDEIETDLDEGNIDRGFENLEKTEEQFSEIEEEKTPGEISELDGIGSTYAERIKQTLNVGSIDELAQFDEDDLKKVKGIGKGKAEKISEQLESYRQVCQRCGQTYVEKTCPRCTEELREELELVKKSLESLKQDVDPDGSWELDEMIENIESELSVGEFEQTVELLDFTKDELAAAEQLYTIMVDIESLLKAESELINRHTYLEAHDSMTRSLRRGNYHRAGLKAKKIREYIEKEKKYQDIDGSELTRVNIEEFSSDMMGLGKREGENVYKEGFHTLKDVYKAGKKGLVKSGIDEKTSDRLMKILEPIFEDLDIERDHTQEETLESKEDMVFRETEEDSVEPKEEPEQIKRTEEKVETEEEIEEEKPSRIEEPEEEKVEDEEETPSASDIFGEELIEGEVGVIEEESVEFKYWIPAILIPIILAIAGYLLFFM